MLVPDIFGRKCQWLSDILRKAECSIQLNAGNIWLLAMNTWKGNVEGGKCNAMLKRARGWGRTTLITLGLVCRTLNWVPTKLRLSSPLEKGLLALSRAITEIFFYLLNFSIPDFLHWVRSSILLIAYSPFMIQVSISFGFCLKVLIESMVKLSVLTSLFFACEQRWAT